MSFCKSTTLFSEIRSFFKENQGTGSMYALLDVIEKIRLSPKSFFPAKHWNKKYGNHQLFLLSLLFPCFGARNAYDYADCGLFQAFSAGKDLFYRFMGDGRIFWRKLLYAVNLQLLSKIRMRSDFHKDNSPVCLMVDDTDFPKTGRRTEKVGKIFSHVRHSSILGFKGLFLGLTDGKTQTMLDFALLGEKGKNPEKPFGMTAKQKEDQHQAERGEDEAVMERIGEYATSKIELAKRMVKRAIDQGIRFDYLLADSWFACSELIRFIRGRRIKCHYLGMIKMGNTLYGYKGERLTAKALAGKLKKAKAVRYSRKLRYYFSEVEVDLTGMKVKLLFCRKGKHGSWNALVTTDLSLCFVQAYRIYSMRWSIEVFFKEAKGVLNLGKSQARNFASQIAAISIAVLQYNILSVLKRFQAYETLGGLFRNLTKEAAELSITERIWNTILTLVREIAEMFKMEDLMIMDMLINHSTKFDKIIQLYTKDEAA